MIQCGDYNWEIIKDDDSEMFQLTINNKNEYRDTICLSFSNKQSILYVSNFHGGYKGETPFKFKMGFNETPYFVKSLIDGEEGKLYPIHHKDTVKIK